MTRGQLMTVGLGVGILLGVVAGIFMPMLSLVFLPVGLVGLWITRPRA